MPPLVTPYDHHRAVHRMVGTAAAPHFQMTACQPTIVLPSAYRGSSAPPSSAHHTLTNSLKSWRKGIGMAAWP